MRYLVTSEEMKTYDSYTINHIKIPGLVLMERAALTVLEQIEGRFSGRENEKKRVCIMTGMGNNGGDGLALARLLAERDYSVFVWCVGEEEKASLQWKQQKEILSHYPVTVSSKMPEEEYTIWVDALFGVGLSREVSGNYREAINAFNERLGYKVSVDIPSGINTDDGSVMGEAVKADVTVSFGFCKRGLVLYPGCEYAGRLVVADIGISERSFGDLRPTMFALDERISSVLPQRAADGNKGTFGKVLLIAGSVNMAGTAVLAARAAYRVGAGMVKVLTPRENRVIIQETLPEALLGTEEDLEESLDWADVVVIGPGLGKRQEAKALLERVLSGCEIPLVIDADGLNLLAEDVGLQNLLIDIKAETILTPHVGELSRLTGKKISELKKDLSGSAMELAKSLGVTVVAKDARTFVCREKKPICVNLRGNCGMATAGSGDVLAGIIGGLLAQGMDGFRASCVGVYVHGTAGDLAKEVLGEHALMAGDIVEKIGKDTGEVGGHYDK